jgi:hypothetical protein
LQFCPRCGNAVNPEKKFCTSCGASLTPDLPAHESEVPQVPSAPPAAATGFRFTGGLVAVAGLIIVILGIVFIVYPALTGSGILSAAGVLATPAPTPVPTGGSWVEVITEEPTPIPTTETPAITIPTTTLTTNPTTPQITKAVVCSSDRVNCNNLCVNLRTDYMNCGHCGTICPKGQFCLNGQCMKSCTASQTSCPDGCFDLQTNPDHCGTCNNDCPRGLICYRGMCMAPDTPQPVPI